MLGTLYLVKAEENPTLLESARQQIFRNASRYVIAGSAAGVGHEHAVLVVDRNADPALQNGSAVAVSQAKLRCELGTNASC